MWFTIPPLEIYISATAFYSAFLASKCRADDIPGKVWNSDDESVHVYRTEIPWRPINLGYEKTNLVVVAWIAVLSVAVSVGVIVCICCLCWKYSTRSSARRRRSTNAALVPPTSRTFVAFQTDHDVDIGIRNPVTGTGNVYSRGVVNFAFTRSLHDPVQMPQQEDGPPAYSTVISETSQNDKPTNVPFPPVSDTKVVETPPPAYVTVAPFQ